MPISLTMESFEFPLLITYDHPNISLDDNEDLHKVSLCEIQLK